MGIPNQLIEMTKEQEINHVACQMSVNLLGLKHEEMIKGIEFAGLAANLAIVENGNVNLFI
jgi:peroxiredoxin family protein